MSVKEEYEALLKEVEEMRKEINSNDKVLKRREQEYNRLEEKKKQLSERSSELAKRLLQEVSREIFEKEKTIRDLKNCLDGLKRKLEKAEQRIDELKENPSEYEEEQAKIMAQQLKKYVNEHEIEFGSDIIKKMVNYPNMRSIPDRYGDYYIPDGNVVISIDSKIIVKSDDFYFEQALDTRKRDPYYDNMIVNETEWFANYLKLFYEALRTKIEEAFKEHPNFNVKFTDDTHFTIELR